MNRQIIFIFGIAIFLTFSGCLRVLTWVVGVKPPKVENKESLMNYCSEYGLLTSNIYSVTLKDFNEIRSMVYNNIPSVFILNRYGEFMAYADSIFNNEDLHKTSDSIPESRYYHVDSIRNYQNIIKSLRDLDGREISTTDCSNFDYSVFIFWAKWTGKLNKDVKRWEQRVLSDPTLNVQVFKINMDFQEYWGLDKKQCYNRFIYN